MTPKSTDSAHARWQRAQEWEKTWHGSCVNSYYEEEKQLVYAQKMGLVCTRSPKTPYRFDMRGTSVLDIGGGPTSLLLKCVNVRGKVIDPLHFPDWVLARYALVGIEFECMPAEHIDELGWEEAWIYNVLQHTKDPQHIIANAQQAAKLIRIFEWIDTPPNIGHPHRLTEQWLNEMLGGEGRVEQLNGQGVCYGKAYYGVFKGRMKDESTLCEHGA